MPSSSHASTIPPTPSPSAPVSPHDAAGGGDEAALPVVAETLEVRREVEQVGAVRVRIESDVRQERVDPVLARQHVDVRRVPRGVVVDARVEPWREGEVPVVPVYEEVVVRQLVLKDADWFPTVEGGSMYLRPFMFASEAFLGVRPAKEYKFLVIASPAGNYFKSGAPAVSIWVSQDYVRAAPGGTGAAKTGGNYAASLVPQAEAIAKGHDQVVFLDAVERRWIEELGGMNLFFVFDDGSVITPPLGGTILPGVTRDSLIQLLRDEGLTVREERYAVDQWRTDAESGRLVETMACGTAAVVTPVGKVAAPDYEFTIGSGGPGQLTVKLREQLVGIQRGTVADLYGWTQRL